ncbi:L-lactate permease [Candidatus Burkholderia brachyanthoides]|nr:L-lactate permease [Candidatus Burkholderia brachyanthoides]
MVTLSIALASPLIFQVAKDSMKSASYVTLAILLLSFLLRSVGDVLWAASVRLRARGRIVASMCAAASIAIPLSIWLVPGQSATRVARRVGASPREHRRDGRACMDVGHQADAMFSKLMRTGPRLSDGVIGCLMALASFGYVGLFVAGKSLLPAYLFRDAEKIQAQMNRSSTYDGSSFDAVGKFYGMFGSMLLNVFVMVIGVSFIFALLSRVKHAGTLDAALIFGVLCVFFNLFVASKDTLVVAMLLIIVWTLRRRNAMLTAAVALFGYLAHASLVRGYFLLIVGVGAGVWMYRHCGRRRASCWSRRGCWRCS